MDDEPSLNTNDLTFWALELQAGRPAAAEPVFRKILTAVERRVRAMFARFSRVGRFVEVEDVAQNTALRLLRAMRDVRPASTRQFYALTNELIRRELIDLTRHHFGPLGAGTHLASAPSGDGADEHPAVAPAADGLDHLTAFHEAVARLPAEQREAIGLTYYHDWTQAEIARLFGVSVRTVQRWLDAAVTTLRTEVGPH
ncbi:MAG: sigma-70 family RNA polymerase sigma factor [Gemmataceae bacterium]